MRPEIVLHWILPPSSSRTWHLHWSASSHQLFFPHRWEFIFVAGWMAKKIPTKNLIPRIPHSITPFFTQGRRRTWIYCSTSAFYGNGSCQWCLPIQARDNGGGSGERTETRRLYLWLRRGNLQGDFLIPSLRRSGSVEIKGKSIRAGV